MQSYNTLNMCRFKIQLRQNFPATFGLFYLERYSMPCIDNLMEEKSYVSNKLPCMAIVSSFLMLYILLCSYL
jgi:hypothetical protein